jgi:hypothetical protein
VKIFSPRLLHPNGITKEGVRENVRKRGNDIIDPTLPSGSEPYTILTRLRRWAATVCVWFLCGTLYFTIIPSEGPMTIPGIGRLRPLS